jgi:hypothetical protein
MPAPITATPIEEEVTDPPPDLFAHESTRLPGAVLPREDAHGHDAVEAELPQGAEELVPVHLSLTDVQVLVDPHRRSGWVHDVTQARRGPMVERVRHVQMLQQVAGVLHDPRDVPALMEGMRGAVQERHEW